MIALILSLLVGVAGACPLSTQAKFDHVKCIGDSACEPTLSETECAMPFLACVNACKNHACLYACAEEPMDFYPNVTYNRAVEGPGSWKATLNGSLCMISTVRGSDKSVPIGRYNKCSVTRNRSNFPDGSPAWTFEARGYTKEYHCSVICLQYEKQPFEFVSAPAADVPNVFGVIPTPTDVIWDATTNPGCYSTTNKCPVFTYALIDNSKWITKTYIVHKFSPIAPTKNTICVIHGPTSGSLVTVKGDMYFAQNGPVDCYTRKEE